MAAQIANEIVVTFAEYNKNFQASRYADTEASLAAQLDELDLRIQETFQNIQALGDDASLQAERDKLEVILNPKPAIVCFNAANL